MKLNDDEAFKKLKKVSDLYELYFELSKFEFKNSPHKNAAKKFFQIRAETINKLLTDKK